MMNSYYPQPYAQPTQQMTAVPSDVPPQPEIYTDTTQNSSYSYNPNTTPVVPTAGNSKPYSVSPVGIDANPLGVYNPIVEPQVPSFSSTGSSPLNNNISSVPVYQQSNLCPPPPSPKEYNILPQQQLQQQPQQYYPPNPSAPVAQEVPPMAQEVPNQYAYQPQPQIQPQVQPQQQQMMCPTCKQIINVPPNAPLFRCVCGQVLQAPVAMTPTTTVPTTATTTVQYQQNATVQQKKSTSSDAGKKAARNVGLAVAGGLLLSGLLAIGGGRR